MLERRPVPSSSASACDSLRTDGESGPKAAQSRYPGSLPNDARYVSRSVTAELWQGARHAQGASPRRSAAVAAVAGPEVADRAQEVHLAEVRSERLDEIEL